MGKLIVIEGTDGSGKSTQFKLMAERLEKENKPFRRLRLVDCGVNRWHLPIVQLKPIKSTIWKLYVKSFQ